MSNFTIQMLTSTALFLYGLAWLVFPQLLPNWAFFASVASLAVGVTAFWVFVKAEQIKNNQW